MRPERVKRAFIYLLAASAVLASAQTASLIGKEIAVQRHLRDGEEYDLSIPQLIQYGEKLFSAKWTSQEGEGRPHVKGTASGPPLTDPEDALIFPRNFNRISGPDSNSCSGCHNEPYEGGGGDRATEVFVLGNRFDFATFDHANSIPTAGAADESGKFVTLQNIADERKTIGMNGSGFIEMLARQMTADLQAIRDSMRPGRTRALITKGVSFGPISNSTVAVCRTDSDLYIAGRRLYIVGEGVKTVEDSCPACCSDITHLDNYTTNTACSGVGSLPNAITVILY